MGFVKRSDLREDTGDSSEQKPHETIDEEEYHRLAEYEDDKC